MNPVDEIVALVEEREHLWTRLEQIEGRLDELRGRKLSPAPAEGNLPTTPRGKPATTRAAGSRSREEPGGSRKPGRPPGRPTSDELLAHMRKKPGRTWTVAELRDALGAPTKVIENRILHLKGKGLVLPVPLEGNRRGYRTT